MAFTVKYFAEWTDFDGSPCRLELLTNAVNVAEELRVTNCIVTYPEIYLLDKEPVSGAGIEISFLSPTKLYFLNKLYTTNPQEVLIKLFRNGTPGFLGWMDSEQYSDEWTDAVNYEVTITGNNGFALLERIAYNGPSTLTSLYDLVHAAIVATGLPYATITVATGTTIGGEGTLETCLDKIYSKPDNFVDEKGVVMSWREVLESILTPLDLGIFAYGNTVYLRDTHTMGAGGTQKSKTMAGTSGGSSGIPAPIMLDWVLDESTIAYEKALNRASVKFNKYKYDKVSFPITEDTVGGSFTTHTMTDPEGKEYTERRYSACAGYDMTGVPFYDFVLVYDNETGKLIDSFLRLAELNSDTVHPAFKIDTGVLMYSGEGRASFEFDLCIEKPAQYRTYTDDFKAAAYSPNVEVQYRIGDRYINSLTAWTNTPAHVPVKARPISPVIHQGRLFIFSNKWINSGALNAGYSTQTIAGFTVPLNSDSAGTPYRTNSIEGGPFSFSMRYARTLPSEYNMCFRAVSLVMQARNDFGNWAEMDVQDEEIIARLDANARDSFEIKTTSGTDRQGASRGGLMTRVGGLYSDSDYATNNRYVNLLRATRGGVTDDVEKLLLRTYLSNKRIPRRLFTCTVRRYVHPFSRYQHALVKRGESNCVLVAKSIEINYLAAESTVTFLEVVPDNASL
jgi:hypothetical protein